MKNIDRVLIVLLVLAVVVGLATYGTNVTLGSAPSGLPATVATTSQITVGTTAITVFATSTCAARIVSTTNKPIMLTFTDAQTPTFALGVAQVASTTVAYDSGQYGCGEVKIYGFDAASKITVYETR